MKIHTSKDLRTHVYVSNRHLLTTTNKSHHIQLCKTNTITTEKTKTKSSQFWNANKLEKRCCTYRVWNEDATTKRMYLYDQYVQHRTTQCDYHIVNITYCSAAVPWSLSDTCCMNLASCCYSTLVAPLSADEDALRHEAAVRHWQCYVLRWHGRRRRRTAASQFSPA